MSCIILHLFEEKWSSLPELTQASCLSGCVCMPRLQVYSSVFVAVCSPCARLAAPAMWAAHQPDGQSMHLPWLLLHFAGDAMVGTNHAKGLHELLSRTLP